jgi:hypothetical protein
MHLSNPASNAKGVMLKGPFARTQYHCCVVYFQCIADEAILGGPVIIN